MATGQHLLASAVASIDDYARAVVPLEPLKTPAVARIWAYVAHVKWECGSSKPTHDDYLDWANRTRNLVGRKRNESHYADACVAVQLASREWQSAHRESELPFGPQTEYAMARAIEQGHAMWLQKGGITAFGDLNPDDMVQIIEMERGIWNIHRRYFWRQKAGEAAQEALLLQRKVVELVSATSQIATRYPAAEPQAEEVKRCLRSADLRSAMAGEAADAAGSVVLAKDAQEKALMAEKYREETAQFVNDALSYYQQALKIEENERAKADAANPTDTGNDDPPVHPGSEGPVAGDDDPPAHPGSEGPVAGKDEPPAHPGSEGPVAGNDDQPAHPGSEAEDEPPVGRGTASPANEDIWADLAAFTSSGGVTAAAALRSLAEALQRPIRPEGRFSIDGAEYGYSITAEGNLAIWPMTE